LVGSILEKSRFGDTFRFNLVDGDLKVTQGSFENNFIFGQVTVTNNSAILKEVISRKVVIRGQNTHPIAIEFDQCVIDSMTASGSFTKVSIDKCTVGELLMQYSSVQRFQVKGGIGHIISFQFDGTEFKGRVDISGVEVRSCFDGFDRTFAHAKFNEKVVIAKAKFPLSVLSDVELKAPIDIAPSSGPVEDLFEEELDEIRAEISAGVSEGERRRRQLERACQLICDRHEKDGRKDLEHRYRRMELKARAFRDGVETSTRFITWSYDFFSDFGRSIFRPLRGLFLAVFVFFVLYWIIGSYAQGLKLDWSAPLNAEAMTDAGLLAIDKIFPFGASVEETDLFDSKLFGGEGGGVSIIASALSVVQTIFSGIMLFLVGLSVRTKLLIG
tara:strand:- start:1029 stop:2186 length:1158 start_codon:yes stop_codon:yes gene_type:complete